MFTFQFLNDKIHNYVFFDKLSKTNTFFSHFERTRGEKKNEYFAPKPPEPDIDRPLFWGSGDPQDPSFGTHPAIYVASEFGTRFETGVDCDFVFQDSLLIGNL